MKTSNKWDVFISHATEDKDDFVRPLAKKLHSFGLKVWYDEFSLNVGDSLFQSINKGMADSEYGIIVLSNIYLEKYWASNELNGFFALESTTGKRILPIWHNITRETVVKYSPMLADRYALNSNEDQTKIVLKLIEKVKPDLLKSIHARYVYFNNFLHSKKERVKISEIKKSPIRHEKLNDNILHRIRLIKSVFNEVYNTSFDHMVDNFRRELYPEDELKRWETMSYLYLETIFHFNISELHIKSDLFRFILGYFCGLDDVECKYISDEHKSFIKESYKYKNPLWDFSNDDIIDNYF